jgi:drug/metabolite transporter (DMT)-like permease
MLFGILFSFLASVCFNINNLLEKQAVDRMATISARRVGHMLRALITSPLWMAGFIVGLLAVGLLAIAYSLAPTAVTQSIFGAGIVLLVPASRLYLGERMGRREHIGIVIIVLAVVLVSFTLSAATDQNHQVSSLHVLIVSAVTTAFAGLVFLALRSSAADISVVFGATCGLIYGVAAIQTKSASVLLQHHGLVHGVPLVLASPYPYVFVVTSLLGLFTFQTGLQRCRIAVTGPTTNIVGSVYVVAVGMAVFDEPLPHSPLLSVLRFVGFALVLVGTAVLAVGPDAGVSQLRLATADDSETGG